MSLFNQFKDMFLGKNTGGSSSNLPQSQEVAGSKSIPDTVEMCLERGHRYFQEKNLQAALTEFNKAVVLSSSKTEEAAAYFNRGRTYSRLENVDAAIADFDHLVQIAPAFPLLYLERGNCFVLKRDYYTAITDYDRAVALLPDGIERAMAYLNRAGTCERLGDLQNALADINRALDTAPEFTPAYGERERVQAEIRSLGQNEQLTSEQVIKATKYFYHHATAAHDKNNLVDALALYSRAVEFSGRQPSIYYARGVVNAKLRRYQQALIDLNKAIELKPQFPAALAERGLVYVELRNDSQAMQDYDSAIEIDPTYALAHINKGSLLALQEKWKDALKSLDEGIKLRPSPEAYFNRAASYEKLGDYRCAIDNLRTYLLLQPNNSLTDSINSRLRELEEKLKG
jgi:tetratricopeptide (TPR) repeat protein